MKCTRWIPLGICLSLVLIIKTQAQFFITSNLDFEISENQAGSETSNLGFTTSNLDFERAPIRIQTGTLNHQARTAVWRGFSFTTGLDPANLGHFIVPSANFQLGDGFLELYDEEIYFREGSDRARSRPNESIATFTRTFEEAPVIGSDDPQIVADPSQWAQLQQDLYTPVNPITLKANTTYWLVFGTLGYSEQNYFLDVTTESNETGPWEIGNSHLARNVSAHQGTIDFGTTEWFFTSGALRVEIVASYIPEPSEYLFASALSIAFFIFVKRFTKHFTNRKHLADGIHPERFELPAF